jgi:hypothetical protein
MRNLWGLRKWKSKAEEMKNATCENVGGSIGKNFITDDSR